MIDSQLFTASRNLFVTPVIKFQGFTTAVFGTHPEDFVTDREKSTQRLPPLQTRQRPTKIGRQSPSEIGKIVLLQALK